MKCNACSTGDAIAAAGDIINCLNCGYVGPAAQPASETPKPRIRRGKSAD